MGETGPDAQRELLVFAANAAVSVWACGWTPWNGLHGTHGVLHGIEVAISRLDNLLFMLHHLRRAIWI